MDTRKLFQFTKASELLALAGIEYNTTAKNKMRGKNNYGKDIDFTPEEKEKIERAFWKLTHRAGMKIGKGLQALKKGKA